MITAETPSDEVHDLRRQLAEARQTIQALVGGQVDAVVGEPGTSPVLLAAAQEELRQSRTLLRAVFDGAMDAILLMSPSGEVTDVNAAGCELFGRPHEDLIGHVASDFYEPDFDVAAARQRLHSVGHIRGELSIRRPNGQLRAADFATRTNIVLGVNLAVLRDVTERKATEAALRRTEEHLRQSQKMEAVGRLAGGIAHDFNNFLSVILSYSTMALDDLRPDNPLRADIEEVQKAGQRSCDLTRQLLAFSRQQVLQPKVLVLNEIITGMQRMVRRLLTEEVRLTLLLSSRLGRIEADPGQVEQIILNLAANARDAMPRGGGLSIETANIEVDDSYATQHGMAPGSYVMLSVTDTGTGMDKETQARIFEPFFTTKEKGKGTGLGLATVFGIVQQSRGHVEVESEPEKGATFRVYFPRTDRSDLATLSIVPAPTTLRGSETILLVEDDEQVRTIVLRILRHHGYTVHEVANGGEALLLCEQRPGPIHLMVTDVIMPGMSGRQLADRVGPLRPDMRVLYMSGYTDGEILHHGVLSAGVAFLQKPITPELLLRKVREVLVAPVEGLPAFQLASPERGPPDPTGPKTT